MRVMNREPKFITITSKTLYLWIGVILIVILTAFGGGLYLGQSWHKTEKTETPPWLAKAPPPPPQEETIPEQRLTFYDKLTEKSGKTPKTGEGESSVKPEAKEKTEVKPQNPPPAREESPPTKTKGNYVVHVASVKSRQGAESMAAQLGKKGYKVSVKEVDLGEKGTWYRLLILGYTSKEEAEQTAQTLRKKEGLSPIVRAGKE